MKLQAPVPIDKSNIAEELPKYRGLMVQIMRRQCCHDPENAAGDVFLIIWSQVMEKGEFVRDPAAYIARVCLNYARAHKRKRSNREWQMPDTIQLIARDRDYNVELDIETAMKRVGLSKQERELL